MMGIRRSERTTIAGARCAAPLMWRSLFVLAVWPVMVVTGQDRPPQAAGPQAVRLSIGDALRLADSASEDVGIARAAVDAASGRRMQARSGWLPQLSGAASYTRTLKSQFEALAGDDEDGDDEPAPPPPENCLRYVPNPSLPLEDRLIAIERGLDCTANGTGDLDFSKLPFGQANAWTFGLDAQQTLFDRSLAARNRMARAGEAQAAAQLDASRALALLDVAQAYYDAQLAERLLTIADSALAQSERIFRDTELARRVGNAAEFDLLRVTVARDNQRPVVIQRRTNRDLALVRLRQLLDLPANTPVELVTPLGDTGSVALPEFAQGVAAAADTTVAARAVVRAADAMADAAQASRDAIAGQRLPTVRLSSAYTKYAYPSDVFGFGDLLTDWNVAVRVNVPLFTGGRIAGEVREAEANAETARLRSRQTRELAARDGIEVRDQLVAAEARFEASRSTAAQALRAYQIAEIRVREGLSTLTDLSDVRLQLEQSAANQAQAARDVQVARLRALLLRDLPLGAGAAMGGTF
jgi:outer membrane protein